jgi:hypothetical protein
MATTQLPFLYPVLLKSLRLSEPAFQRAIAQTTVSARHKGIVRIRQRRHQSTNFERYGPAKDLLPPIGPQTDQANNKAVEPVKSSDTTPEETSKKDAGSEPERLQTTKESQKTVDTISLDPSEGHPKETVQGPQLEPPGKPLEKVLQMDAPTSPKKPKHPHLEAPPYVHHFDTYTLVKDLGKGGFTQDQSVTMMKAVRSLLATNLDMAREGLVSKSDVENVTFINKCERYFYVNNL